MPAIQPCALLILVGPDWQVETISANAAMLGDYRPSALVGQPLTDLIGTKAIHALRNRLAWLSNGESEVLDFGVDWGGVTLDVRAIHDKETYLIEAELAVEPRLPDGIGMVRSMTDRLNGDDPKSLAEQAMRQLCALTGFDRLTFSDRNGEVIAAVGRSKVQSFLTEGCPVPRLLADRDAEPVALVGNETNGMLDRAAYLAPTDSQREQMEQLEIAAAMSIPLRIDGERVGAIHAHHPSPRRCGAERRSVAHLFAERVAARMARHGWQP